MLSGAIDPETGEVHIYNEYFQAERPVHYHAKKMNEEFARVPAGRTRFIVADPSGKKRSDRDMRSTFSHYSEYGIYFKDGSNKIEDGILKVFSYLELGKLKIHANCVNTIREGINYKYKETDLDSSKPIDEKPKDINNHTMDSLRYMIAELPDDPAQLINESYAYVLRYQQNPRSQAHLPHALRTDDYDPPVENDWSIYY